MIHIQNDHFRAAIRLRGAELASLQPKSNGCELIWQADPAIWGGSAPILFPIVGNLKGGTTRIEGAAYSIPKHGLLRQSIAQLVDQRADSVRLRFASSAQTLELYPFEFVFDALFELTDCGLKVDYEVVNPGSKELLFTLGSHPALALDSVAGTSIEFSNPETLALYGLGKNGLLFRRVNRWFKREQRIPLTDRTFKDDALIFKNVTSRTIRLKTAGDRPDLEVDLRTHPHLALWSKPGAPFVCIEPWFSFDDAADSEGLFEHKPGVLRLAPQKTFATGYALRVV